MNHLGQPFFSIVIFTKNRSEVIGYALESALKQSFHDFEVVVCDNDDPETHETAMAIRKYDDARINYHRTNGRLSMPDNWELGLSMARGRYVLSMTDRLVLKSYALQTIKTAIEHYGEDIYVWGYEELNDQMAVQKLSRVCMESGYKVVESRTLFDLFLHRPYDEYSDYLPKGLNSCLSSALLQEIRSSTGGHICMPISPDHILAFLALAHRRRVVITNEPLFLWWAPRLSNGGSLMHGGETGQRFLRDIGVIEEDLSSHMPIKAIGIHNSICNDLMRLKRQLPEMFQDVELSLFHYFVVCHLEFSTWFTRDGPLYKQKMQAWNQALDRQSRHLAKLVRRCVRLGYPGFTQGSVLTRVTRKTMRHLAPELVALHGVPALAVAKKVLRPWVKRDAHVDGGRWTNILEALEALESARYSH